MSRLSCNECYKQSFHCGHQKDQDLISYLPSFIQDISTQCEKDIIKTLGDLGDKIAFLFFSIKDNIRAQFQISQSRLQILNSNQINQMLGQLVELSNVKKDLTEIEVITQNLEDTLNQKLINLASKETTYQKPSCQQSAESTNYFIEGLTLFTKGDYQQALSSFNTSLRCNPNNIDVMLWKGECLFSTNQFNDALMQFKQVWKLDSTNSKSLYGIEQEIPYISYNNIKNRLIGLIRRQIIILKISRYYQRKATVQSNWKNIKKLLLSMTKPYMRNQMNFGYYNQKGHVQQCKKNIG